MAEKLTKEQLRGVYLAVFDNPNGQVVLDDLCKRADVFDASPLVAGDSHTTHYNLGRQDMVKAILRFLYKNQVDASKAHHQFNNENEEMPKI